MAKETNQTDVAERLLTVDLNTAEAYNMVRDSSGRWASRPAFKSLYTLAGDELKILYAFSVMSGAGIVYNYLFILTSSNLIRCKIRDNNFNALYSVDLGYCLSPEAPVSHAINYNQIVVNSPGFTQPYHCYIGSSPRPAQKVESINPDTPALDLFPGIVASFQDRFVWAASDIVMVNSSGVEPRTCVATNAFSVGAPVLDMFQASNGSLYIITANNVKIIPAESIASSFFQGAIITLPSYNGLNHRNAVATRNGVYALASGGLLNLGTGEVSQLTSYKRNRKITKVAGPGLANDYRSVGKIYNYENGMVISFGDGKPFLVINQDYGYKSWFDDNTFTGELVGTLKGDDGTVILAFNDGIVALYGDSPDCQCGLALELDVPGSESWNFRTVIVSSLGNGLNQVKSYFRNTERDGYVPFAAGSSVIGTGIWGSSTAIALEFASIDFRQNIRTDGVFFELGFGRDTIVQSVQLEVLNQGDKRNRNFAGPGT